MKQISPSNRGALLVTVGSARLVNQHRFGVEATLLVFSVLFIPEVTAVQQRADACSLEHGYQRQYSSAT